MTIAERKHPAVRVQVGELDAEIDVEIAPLIREMWHAGIKTSMSCQDWDGEVWIEFESVSDLENFVTAICPSEDEDPALHDRIARDSWDHCETWWEYRLIPIDIFSRDVTAAGDAPEEYGNYRPVVLLRCSVKFPRSDLAQVERQMAAANRKAA